jgi:hypothetical protein
VTDDDSDRPACTLVWPGDTCYCTGRPGCMWPDDDYRDDDIDEEEVSTGV